MSDFVKQNAKILRSLNINIFRLADSTMQWFENSQSIPTGIIWTRGEQPEPPEKFDRIVTLLSIQKKEIEGSMHLLFSLSDNCPSSQRISYFTELLPHEQLYVSIVLINKYLK